MTVPTFTEIDELVASMPEPKLREEMKKYLRLFHAVRMLQIERLEAIRVRPNDVVVLRQSDDAEAKVESAMDALALCFPDNHRLVLLPGDKIELYKRPAQESA